jgi:hypothetical protein
LGWPTSNEIRDLDKAHIIVEGRFTQSQQGAFFGAFAGALDEISAD